MTTTEETPAKTSRFGRATKFSLAGGLGAAALGIGAVVALPTLTASPAYAVAENDNGTINLEIRGPEDAEGLEETLAEYGVQAEVDFPPGGYVCDESRYTPNNVGEVGEDVPDETGTVGSAAVVERNGSPVLTMDVDPDDHPIGGDLTLVIEIPEDFFGDADSASFSIGDAKGEVGECNPYQDDVPGEAGADMEGEVKTYEEGTTLEDDGDIAENDDGSKNKD